jgi:von Willebrand factor type A domain-containing protein/peptidase M66-like protein
MAITNYAPFFVDSTINRCHTPTRMMVLFSVISFCFCLITLPCYAQVEDPYSGPDPVTPWARVLNGLQAAEGTQGSVSVSIRSLNAQLFPFVFLDVNATDEGGTCSTFSSDNFRVSENGVSETDFFSVTPPNENQGVRLVDVVFIMDNSGSMGGDQLAVRNNVFGFVDKLTQAGINFAFGVTRYGQSANSGRPAIEDNGNLTTNASYFKDNLWTRNVTSGGTEPGYLAIVQSASGFNFRPGSRRVFVIITDENPNQGGATREQALGALQSGNTTLFAVTESALFSSFTSLVTNPAEQLLGLSTSFDQIFTSITNLIGGTYRITYKASNETIDGVERTVEVEVICGSNVGTDYTVYLPGSAPKVIRAAETIDLSKVSQSANTDLTIEVNVTDQVQPFVRPDGVTLYYRSTTTDTNAPYSSVIMTQTNATTFEAKIPGNAVSEPGIDYYVSATDGISASTDPEVDAYSLPYTIAVFPNVAPVLVHEILKVAEANTPITICAVASDTTESLSGMSLHYRKKGELIFQVAEMGIVTAGPCNVNGESNAYEATIPAERVTTSGIEYFLDAVDNFNVHTTSGNSGQPNFIPVLENNCESEDDCDGDALLDVWEIEGIDIDGDGNIDLDLPAMGADPYRKDIFVEIDFMENSDHSHRPSENALRIVTEAFDRAPVKNKLGRRDGIALHIDAGPLSLTYKGYIAGGNGTDVIWGNISKSGPVGHRDFILGGLGIPGGLDECTTWVPFQDIKDTHFSKARQKVFHYAISAHSLCPNNPSSGKSRGVIVGPFISASSDFAVTLRADANDQKFAGTFMHELGHNLGLGHGGGDSKNYKPNYLSVMNYLFQFRGLYKGGNFGTFDYSRQILPTLDESQLNEFQGLMLDANGYFAPVEGADGFGTVFFDEFGVQRRVDDINMPFDWEDILQNDIQDNVEVDLDCSAGTVDHSFWICNHFLGNGHEKLVGHNDWDNIVFDGGAIGENGLDALPLEVDQDTLDELDRNAGDPIGLKYAVDLTGPTVKSLKSGAVMSLNFSLKNQGEESGTYSITHSSDSDWVDREDIPTEVQLAGGEQTVIPIQFKVPTGTPVETVGSFTLLASSIQDSRMFDSATVKLTVLEELPLLPGDLDGNGAVDLGDYLKIRSLLGKCDGDYGYLSAADYSSDGCVAYDDYQFWYRNFFTAELRPPGC